MNTPAANTRRIICTVSNDLIYDQRMIRICTSLAKAGYRVELVGRQLPASKPLVSQTFSQTRLKCRFNKGKLFYLEFNFRLLVYLLFKPADLIWAVDLDTLLPGFLVSRLRQKAIVYDAHEYFTEVPEIVGRPLVKKIWELLAAWIIPRLRHACTVGPALAQALRARYGTAFEVIRNVPSRRFDQPVQKASPPVVLYQGALNEGRGLEAAIEAFEQIDWPVQLWLAGEGDLSGKLRDLVKTVQLEDRVRFHGYLRPEALARLTPQAMIGLNLLENRGLSYYYSLANKAFDYVQAGIPSIQMDFPEYRALNQEHEVFVLLGELSPTAVANAITHLMEDQDLYTRLCKNCLLAAQHWNWEAEERRLLPFVERVFDA